MKPCLLRILPRFVVLFAAVLGAFSGPLYAQEPVAKQELDRLLDQFVREFVAIKPGTGVFPRTFTMGGSAGGPLAIPSREVVVERFFRIHKYEMTQELYAAVMGVNPSRWKGKRNSVEMVSFQEAVEFCKRITPLLQARKHLKPTERVRLPTEVEWEYSCRAGTDTLYSFGNSAATEDDVTPKTSLLNEYAWHTGNAAGNDPVVGALKPNAWGLYDMHGYLWEYVSDPYAAWTEPVVVPDAEAPATQAARIIRGGSWRDHHSMLTSSFRLTIPDHAASDAIGFRCVIAEE